jgi:hypothetical protein
VSLFHPSIPIGLSRQHVGRRSVLALGLAAALAGCAENLVGGARQSVSREDVPSVVILIDGPDRERLQQVGETILPSTTTGIKWQFQLMASDDLRAFRRPENSILLSKSLLALCENDGQLAAILALTSMDTVATGTNLGGTTQNLPTLGVDRDVATIRALAKVGYDPRDALQIAKHRARTSVDDVVTQVPRWIIMETELRRLGYQV